jgi:hypothetical protein
MKQRILFTLLGILFLNLAYGQTGKFPEPKLNKELVAILDTIHQEDQKYREESLDLEKKYGWDSKEVQDVWKIINVKDSINLIKVEKILAEYGWPGADIIGETGNKTLFLVIQHADAQTQEKYLPMLRDAVKNGKTKANYLALMEDRVLLAEGEKQIYGSQLQMNSETNKWELAPMIDPDSADERRAEVGLKPLAEYLINYDLTWDVENFEKRMEEYDAEKNKK